MSKIFNVEKIGLALYKLITFPYNVLLITFKMRSEAMSPDLDERQGVLLGFDVEVDCVCKN